MAATDNGDGPSDERHPGDPDALGISLPSPAYLIGVIVFSVVGIVGYYYGKRHGRPHALARPRLDALPLFGRRGCSMSSEGLVDRGLVRAWLTRVRG
jgi:hypothetical protein